MVLGSKGTCYLNWFGFLHRATRTWLCFFVRAPFVCVLPICYPSSKNPNKHTTKKNNWLVVSTHLKNISQIGNLPQLGLKIKHIWNHHLDKDHKQQHTFPEFLVDYFLLSLFSGATYLRYLPPPGVTFLLIFLGWFVWVQSHRIHGTGRNGRDELIYHKGVSLNGGTPFHTPKWSFLVGKPMVVGYHHFKKPP